MRLLPITLAVVLASCASTPRNVALDSYPAGVQGRTDVTYYDVHGRTYGELSADMRRLGPKNNGSSYVGETRSPMAWSWRTETMGARSCALRDVRVTVNAQILLPRWTPPDDADSSLVAEWKRFITALELHEAGHKDISAKAGRDLKDQLRGMIGLCSQVGLRASDIARRIIDRATEEQKQYDAETRHGLTQGTGFGPPRSMVVRDGAAVRTTLSRAAIDSIQRVRAMERVRSDSETALVTRLVVTPDSLALQVGDSLAVMAFFLRLDVRGVTASGDTLRGFARSYMIDPGDGIERVGRMIVARRPGDAGVWVVLGPDPRPEARAGTLAVRVPIHVH
jgi:predicted secreted Zn-dependent protease